MLTEPAGVVIGVDTHSETHVAVVLDELGRKLATASFDADAHGYEVLLGWAASHGAVTRAGVEGTGDYGAGLAAYLGDQEVTVVEVNRPDRARRRRRGKSDPVDAENAARAVLAGEATTVPKDRHTVIESLRVLRLARASAMKARTGALNQVKDLTVTAPEPLRSQLRPLTNRRRVTLAASWMSHGPLTDPLHATRRAITTLAHRVQQLSREIRDLDREIIALVTATAPRLLSHTGVGPDSAAQLLITAGANPHRIRNEAAFAALCGVSPVAASTGLTNRHRLNRGGDRQANRALWAIAFTRLRYDERTKTYAARATTRGKNPKEIRRLLKRYISRELFPSLTADINALT